MTLDKAAGQPGRDRLVPLAGAMNFRDLGGYGTADGRTVRWGCVYRSDGLDQLTDADVEVLSQRGIRLVCDLRNDREVTNAPSRLPDHPELRQLRFPIGGDTGETTSILELILVGEVVRRRRRRARLPLGRTARSSRHPRPAPHPMGVARGLPHRDRRSHTDVLDRTRHTLLES